MTAVHVILTARSDEVLRRWRDMVRGTLVPESLPTVELIDHLPVFLHELIAALRVDLSPDETSPTTWETAAGHGEQRLRLGFSLDSVVREYGVLRDAILATVREAGAEVTFRELQILFDGIIGGIASAVSEYARQRNAELQRQHNEHIAFIAHELRNPLSSATMAFDLLRRTGHIPGDHLVSQALERGLQQMREGIDHSLSLARTASGVELRPQRVRIASLVREVESASAAEALDKRVELRSSAVQDLEVEIDLRLIRSALDNLVRNAIKYSCPGSSVELRADLVGGQVRIEVEDCCGGLPPGKVEEAFAPFVRLRSDESGFGVGLAIAKHAVDSHGGSLRVQNLPGKGCIFVLELPTAPSSAW